MQPERKLAIVSAQADSPRYVYLIDDERFLLPPSARPNKCAKLITRTVNIKREVKDDTVGVPGSIAFLSSLYDRKYQFFCEYCTYNVHSYIQGPLRYSSISHNETIKGCTFFFFFAQKSHYGDWVKECHLSSNLSCSYKDANVRKKCWLLIIKRSCSNPLSHVPIFGVLLRWGNNHQKCGE